MSRTFTTEPVVRLDATRGDEGERSYAFQGYERTIVAHHPHEVRAALRGVDAAARQGCYAAGFVAYEAAAGIDPAFVTRPPDGSLPLVWFAVYRERKEMTSDFRPDGHGDVTGWRPAVGRAAFDDSIARIRAYIAAGDTYQVNFTFPMSGDFDGDPAAFYRDLCLGQRTAFSAYVDTGRHVLISASPELFFRLKDGRLTTRPMKGTHRRGRWPEEDRAHAEWLRTSDKDRAENLMIVDLLRNDMGRVSETGSVSVETLWDVERYETVLQMTSTITSRVPRGTGVTNVMDALFPCGSVTGAPKVRTMEIISELEVAPRGVYTGAIGYVGPGPEAVFNVAIRTVCLDRETKRATFGVGGGITYDSRPDGEYAECLTKARLLSQRPGVFDLFETMRFDPGTGIFLRSRHLDRLAASAGYFGFRFDREAVGVLLDARLSDAEETLRVRLVLSRDGSCRIEASPLGRAPIEARRAIVSDRPVRSDDPFLYHKTTRRAVYDDRLAALDGAAEDVILINERGELTECSIGNIVVERGGERWTPPVSCGLLRGTFREELLAHDRIKEKVLTPEDLDDADAVFMINSVREWVRLAVVGQVVVG